MSRTHRTFLVGALLLTRCGWGGVSRSDPRLPPLWKAIAAVDREAMGFTPIASDAKLGLEGKQLWGDDYDAMMHVTGDTYRSIAFRKVGSGYQWIGEQEIHHGPGSIKTPDGPIRESIVVDYNTSGAWPNQVLVSYTGDDPRLAGRIDITLADVAPILREWKTRR